jgi:hypothetical protein
MSKTILRRCDVCHKREGVEIEAGDFVDQALTMTMDNFDGSSLTISCNITIKNDSHPDGDNIIDDVINGYTPTDQFNSDIHYHDTYPTSRDIAEAQLEQIMVNTQNIGNDTSDLCKVCFKTMLSMVERYAKFDEEVKF